MGVSWTREQQQVIDLRNRNILVSAAAGSGKTAVLVERILNKMTRTDAPVDIDRLLVVTFTRAAAGEMKERLRTAVEKRLESDPENEHLQRQQTLIHNAQINTIDGFCSYVIRNYFHTIDLDPGYRIANEGELKLLRYDVAKELVEEKYAEGCEEFTRFAEVFAVGKSDDILVELILKLYDFSMSNPWPKEWLEECRKPYQAENFEMLQESPWMKKMWQDVKRNTEQAAELLERNLQLVLEADGPYMYEEAIRMDQKILGQAEEVCRKQDFDGCVKLLSGFKFAALSRKKDDTVSQSKREEVKRNRDQIKEILKGMRERYFYGNAENVLAELKLCRGPVEELISLTEEFIDAFSEKKKQKNIVDFSDMEHFALDILVKKRDGELVYTEAAEEFSHRFEEILIDEYQDSNLVQETLLQSVSRLRHGKHNIFMVGDVKQSIYRFRLARPELFMEKYETYSQEDSLCQRIDLHKNFRSRAEVLEGVNFIFRQIMGKELGEVEYDDAAALYPGASFPEEPRISGAKPGSGGRETESPGESVLEEREQRRPGGEEFRNTELLLAEMDTEELADDTSEQTAQELEARMIGRRILEIVGQEHVVDKATGEYRPAGYRDCVILLRTLSGWAETFAQVLLDMGIPAYATSKTGYFSALEVVTVLNYLHICDNPMQEIPFTGVLLSPIAGCTAQELAGIKAEFPEDKIYRGAWKYCTEGQDQRIREKLERFFSVYEQIRQRVSYTPIHELIQLILKLTGYETFAAAMPGGDQRKANLRMLVEKAMEYEGTSYRGLFNFIRYMEQLQKYEVDFGEISTIGENEDTVRIMSIHKSKGLEFPIVFAAGMGKRFNMTDANAGLVIHPDLGIGMNGIDPRLRLKTPTLLRQVMQKQIRLESLGEELRVLYVALTRAKEKLILTGTVSKLDKKTESLCPLTARKKDKLSYGMLESAQDYLGWILPALARHPSFETLYERVGAVCETRGMDFGKIPFIIKTVRAAELTGEELKRQISWEQRYREYMNWDCDRVYEEEVRRSLQEKFSYQYPYTWLQEIPAKISVSELKRQGMEGEAERGGEAEELIQPEPVVPFIPAFMQKEKAELKGTARGTAYHRVLEGLDYEKTDSAESIQEQIQRMEQQGKLDHEMAVSVRASQIHWYASSYLGQRMRRAQTQGKLWREQQFVMSIPASEKETAWGDQEQIMVQGIIDAFFEEKNGLVLVDYKTDYVEKGKEQELADKYKKQLVYYARALERVRRLPVKEVYLYSFAAGKALKISMEKGE